MRSSFRNENWQKNGSTQEKNLRQCHFVSQNNHMTWPGVAVGILAWSETYTFQVIPTNAANQFFICEIWDSHGRWPWRLLCRLIYGHHLLPRLKTALTFETLVMISSWFTGLHSIASQNTVHYGILIFCFIFILASIATIYLRPSIVPITPQYKFWNVNRPLFSNNILTSACCFLA
jgi:hypothetical protein